MILSQDKKVMIPYGHYILKIMESKELDKEGWKPEDVIYPYNIVVMLGLENVEIMGRYETLEQATIVMDAICSGSQHNMILPSVEFLKDNGLVKPKFFK